MIQQTTHVQSPAIHIEKLSTRGMIGYASGILGWSILMNIISVMLIYFYLPPSNAGLTPLVPQIAVFGVFTLLSLIVASGRFIDAFTDPLIAFFSDHSKHRKGRRIPFMQWAILPCVVFCILIFVPGNYDEHVANYYWLAVIQACFYIALTFYVVPYTALLPELARSHEEKIYYSAWLSAGFVGGIIISSQTPLLADLYQEVLLSASRATAMQWSISTLSVLAGVFMVIPILTIDEQKHCIAVPATIGLKTSLIQTLGNKNFRRFVIAEALYLISLIIIVSGLLYYLRVLLDLEESIGGTVMGVMVLLSLFFYPLIIRIANQFGKKRLILVSLAYLSILLLSIFFLGQYPIPPKVQIYGFAVLASFPLASLGILPYAVIAEIADDDQKKTGQQKEAMYFAVRNLAVKIGQTLGIAVFAILTLFGKDPGHDYGIRLSGIIGCILCALAFISFYRYRETDFSQD